MTPDDVLADPDFRRCADFHGHVCPGLAIGYRAAKAGLEWLAEGRAMDEELVAIVENNACGVDAVQVLTGCTFGKGNLIFKDHGKQVFIFLGRTAGKGVRVAKRPDTAPPDPVHRSLMEKIREETATPEERRMFWERHYARCRDILGTPTDGLFWVRPVEIALPPKARIEPSVLCDRCGEPAMASRIREVAGRTLCMDCISE